ncbi:uncharacterized protein LOC144690173 [Cetorhinus maximus]
MYSLLKGPGWKVPSHSRENPSVTLCVEYAVSVLPLGFMLRGLRKCFHFTGLHKPAFNGISKILRNTGPCDLATLDVETVPIGEKLTYELYKGELQQRGEQISSRMCGIHVKRTESRRQD